MDEYTAKRLQILGRCQEILFRGIMEGQIRNLVVCNSDKFKEVWFDKMDQLWDRISTMEECLNSTYDLIHERTDEESQDEN